MKLEKCFLEKIADMAQKISSAIDRADWRDGETILDEIKSRKSSDESIYEGCCILYGYLQALIDLGKISESDANGILLASEAGGGENSYFRFGK